MKLHYIRGKWYSRYNKECKDITGYSFGEIKDICKDKLGRLPRPGREVYIGRAVGDSALHVYLHNRAGSLEVRTWESMNMSEGMKF